MSSSKRSDVAARHRRGVHLVPLDRLGRVLEPGEPVADQLPEQHRLELVVGPVGNRVRVDGRPVQAFDERGVVRAERVAPDRVVVGHHGRDGRGAVGDGAPRQLERRRSAWASDMGEHRHPVPGGGARGAHDLRDLLVGKQSRLAGRAAWHQRVDTCIHELIYVRG